MARTGPKSLTKSLLRAYFDCPQYARFVYASDEPVAKTYPMLCGEAVHAHIRQMYNQAPAGRTFFYRTAAGAIRGFVRRWRDTLQEFRDVIRNPDREEEKRYAGIGAAGIARYWDDNVNAPRPLEVERTYVVRDRFPLPVKGVIDQVRAVSLDWIAAHRPELIVDGALAPGYDPAVIVDLKSGYKSYDAQEILPPPLQAPDVAGEPLFAELSAHALAHAAQEGSRKVRRGKLAPGHVLAVVLDPVRHQWRFDVRQQYRDPDQPLTNDDWIQYQFPLHHDRQPLLYAWLYAQQPDHDGRLPVAFGWYHLRTGKVFWTYPRREEFPEMEAELAYVARNLAAAEGPTDFPKHTGLHCRACEYRIACYGEKPMVIAPPEDFRALPAAPPVQAEPPPKKKPPQRLRFRPGWTLRDPALDERTAILLPALPEPPPPSFGPLFAAHGVYYRPDPRPD